MALISVGHGSLRREALTSLLHGAGIDVVTDIRRYPNSRHNPDVEGETMNRWLAQAHIGYRADARLGGRRRLPAGAVPEDTWWRVKQFAAYAAFTRTEPFVDGLTELLERSKEQQTVMMCSESVWWRCHRRLVADVSVLRFGVPVRHLMHDGRLVEHTAAPGARLRADGQVWWDG